MKFSEYISSHQVFTTASLMTEMDSPSAAEEQLRLAVRSGTVDRVRRGLLVSNYGRFEGATVDPAAVVAAADPQAILSYHSALEAHGVAHNVGFVCRFRSDRLTSAFAFRGIRYIPSGGLGDTETQTIRTRDGSRRVTTKEQTLVDCLDRPSLSGGVEEAVRSLTAFAYLDFKALLALLDGASASTVARVGWLLSEKADDWHVEREVLDWLEARLGHGPYRLGSSGAGEKGWSSAWKLVLPDSNEEVASWITPS